MCYFELSFDTLPHSSEPSYQGENFTLSYISLPQCIWSGSPKNFQKLEFSGSPGKVGNPGKKFSWIDWAHRADHFEIPYASVRQTMLMGLRIALNPPKLQFPSPALRAHYPHCVKYISSTLIRSFQYGQPHQKT